MITFKQILDSEELLDAYHSAMDSEQANEVIKAEQAKGASYHDALEVAMNNPSVHKEGLRLARMIGA